MFLAVLGTACCVLPGNADEPKSEEVNRSRLNTPILFTKRFNYQGLHIYDTFYQWKPGGGIYILENPADSPEQHRIHAVIDPTTPETLGNGIYFDPSLSFDAKKLLFCFKGTPNGNSVIYEIGIDGKGLRQVTNLDKNGNPYKGSGGGHHDVKPSYLADGRIVFCSTRYSGLVPCANNGVTILHIANADGSDIHTISVNNVTEFDPNMLTDGRILFGRWEYIDKNALTIQSLWTVMPDGTRETALYANNMVFPEAVLQAKQVPGAEHLVVATFCPHNSPPRGSIAMIDTRLGKNDEKAITNFEHPDKPTFDRGDSCDPWPLNSDLVLYSGIPDDANAPVLPAEIVKAQNRNTAKINALMMIGRNGQKIVIHSDPAIDLHNPIPVAPRPVPMVTADTTDRSKITGNFFVQNVYEGMPQLERGSLKWLRIVEETSRVSESPGGTWMNQTFSISSALAWSPKIYHGIVPVEEDGSVYFEAPAGRSLYFQLLDKDYRLVRSMRTFIQAAPGTTRSCVGCHQYEPSSNAPVRVISGEPRKPVAESWGGGYLDYASMVQPVLDKNCVSCHGGEKGMQGGLDLSGGWTECFSISYENLTARREKQYTADLISGICCMNGTAYWSCKIFGPYEHGSGNAKLVDVLLSEPHKTAMTKAEREFLMAWIDSNGIYFGTWDYTKTGPLAREYVPAKNALIGVMKANRCVECHADENGNIKRFDDWINLEHPERSRILRAPLAETQNAQTAGCGLALCRNRKVDQSFSRLGLMFKSGYEHAVKPLDQFPTQKWVPWSESLKGEPVVTFASTDDPVYREMLEIIESARNRQLANPRVDMPHADEIGDGVVAGRSRQIIPQPLPETMPKLNAAVDDDGIVRLSWERSEKTIGLISEIHRLPQPVGAVAFGPAQPPCDTGLPSSASEISNRLEYNTPDFVPTPRTLLKRTERFEFADQTAPVGLVWYALVFVSDPAETCGTYKSGAVLDYNAQAAKYSEAEFLVPTQKRMEDRCPLSMVKPMRSEPVWTSIVVPEPKSPPAPKNLRAISEPGLVTLRWHLERPGLDRFRVYADGVLVSGEKPTASDTFEYVCENNNDVEFVVESVGKSLVGGRSSVRSKPLPEIKDPVFELKPSSGTLVAPAKFDGNVLNLSGGGHLVVPADKNFDIKGPFSLDLWAKFDDAGRMPILVSCGQWNTCGWFLQNLGGRFRFHVGGVDCDGGTVTTGEWTRITGTFDGRMLRLFQNGNLVAETAAPATVKPWSQELLLGQYNGGITPDYQFKGSLKQVRIYHRILPAKN